MRATGIAGVTILLSGAAGLASAQVEQRQPAGVQPAPAIVQPVIVRSVQPEYTAEALRAKVTGDVHILALVDANGTVTRAEVLKSLDTRHGLDQQALAAVRDWTFEPGLVEGRPAPFAVTVVVEFRLRSGPGVPVAGVTSVRVAGQSPRAVAPALSVAGKAAPESADEEFVYRKGAGVVMPAPLRTVPPRYPTRALAKGAEGEVVMEAVVRPDGRVTGSRVVKSLGADFDRAVSDAARSWRFVPGTFNGKPVPVLIHAAVQFRLEDGVGLALPPIIDGVAGEPESGSDTFTQGAYPESTPGLEKPEVVGTVTPKYTADAMRTGIEGDVLVDIVVMGDGSVGRARIVKSLDPVTGLDAEALAAVRQWTFRPGMLDGKPVPVLTTVSVQFRR